MNGFLIINKEKDMTSFDVVRKVKKELGTKKIGHSGTLDPMTEGVLVLAIGRATKYLSILTNDSSKIYECEATFGLETETDDIYGKVLETDNEFILTDKLFASAVNKYTGEYEQFPPIYSAKKKDGKKLYEYAREGKDVEITPSLVDIIRYIEISKVKDNKVRFVVEVSKGTYIRSLIRDMGRYLGTHATMSDLKRLSTDGFSISESVKLTENLKDSIIDLDTYLKSKYNTYYISSEKIEKMVLNGVELNKLDNQEYPILYVLKESQKAIALYDEKDDIKSKPIFMIGK